MLILIIILFFAPQTKGMKQLVIFASGNGSNAENLIRHFQRSGRATVAAVFCNRPGAGVVDRARRLGVPVEIINRETLHSGHVASELDKINPDLIILAGFLMMMPGSIISAFPNKIINIHPALLPKFGGKGMYGDNVHRAVLESGERETGITLHYVDEHYDSGDVIFQAKTDIAAGATAESIAESVRRLEMEYFPIVVDQILFP